MTNSKINSPDPSNEARRLQQFLRWDMMSNAIPLVCLPILYFAFPDITWVWLIIAEVAINQVVLAWAYRQLNHNRIQSAITGICLSLWLILLSVAFVVPAVFPMLIILTIWPVILSLSYLDFSSLRLLMIVSTVVMLFCTILSLRQDPFHIVAAVPDWVIPAIMCFFVPAFTGLIFLVLWHYSRRLNDTLSQTKQANAALLESERHLEARVLERTALLGQKNAALEQSQLELAVARDQALDANRAKSNFLAAMSHELRTPLNAIIGYSEMLEEEAVESDLDDFVIDLNKIHGAGKHLLTLINDILDLSKIEAGKMELYLESFDLAEMLRDVVTTVQPLVQKHNNRLTVEFEPSLGKMWADSTKVRQTLFNLLSNAAKFTENGSIKLTAERQDDRIKLVVSDNGIGMTPTQQGRLFEAFTQADASTTRKYGGTGLGLAITKRFCQMMGGDIMAQSELGQGSIFTIVLPVNVPDPKARPVIAEDNSVSDTHPDLLPTTGANTVLVIDDDPQVRDLIQRFLVKDGFRVAAAYRGEEGLQMARELRPDAIILDVMMPGMDGWAVLHSLKADPALADIPVVMATMIDDKNLGYALGASDYLTKPLDRNRLSAIVRKYRKNLQPGLALVVEDDPDSRQVMCRFLEKEGWTVEEAENGRVGLEHIARQAPDLILLDLMMPEMDGFELVNELHTHPQWRTIPVVVVTARELTAEDRRRLNGSVERILQKGAYSREELLQTVRKLVRQSETAELGTNTRS